ncbi:MAG TPA: DUF4234 domain-containing protein [Acidimicrobiales bacterium]|jgi:hypothetical protein|nr:DUF4234 domain-containing protein [Acidimicrobiales bacterium]
MVILLCIVTLGIYSLYWQYSEFQELKDHTGNGLGGGLGLLLAILVGIANAFVLPSEIANMYTNEGRQSPVKTATGWWVFLPIAGGIIWLFKVQGALNDHWVSHGVVPA